MVYFAVLSPAAAVEVVTDCEVTPVVNVLSVEYWSVTATAAPGAVESVARVQTVASSLPASPAATPRNEVPARAGAPEPQRIAQARTARQARWNCEFISFPSLDGCLGDLPSLQRAEW